MGDILSFGIPIFVSLFGAGGGLWAYLQARTSKQLGVRQNDIEQESATVTGFRDLVVALREEVSRLREDRDEDKARMDRIEKDIAVERDLRWTAIQHIRRLYTWITYHIDAEPPAVPKDLEPYVTHPRKGNP